jgi:hypothetical protein
MTGCSSDVMEPPPASPAGSRTVPFDDPVADVALAPSDRPTCEGTEIDCDLDGLADDEETATSARDADTDGDGRGDLIEVAYERSRCATDPNACDCATDATCTPADDFLAVVLPSGPDRAALDLTLDTTPRRADVFMLFDTSRPMADVLPRIGSALAWEPLGQRIETLVPGGRYGIGRHEDFPFAPHGVATDHAFALDLAMTPGYRNMFLPVLQTLSLGDGGDPAGSHLEALYQIATGRGGQWETPGGEEYLIEALADHCPGPTSGAPCFDPDVLPVVLHFTGTCEHGGPASDDPTCGAYEAFSPGYAAHGFGEAASALADAGVRYVGLNTSAAACSTGDLTVPGSPCALLIALAEQTGQHDFRGARLVHDLPLSADRAAIADEIVRAVERAVHHVRFDVTASARDRGARFIESVEPAVEAPCAEPPPHADSCDEAVDSSRASGIHGVVPGTLVRYRLVFRNDEPAAPRSRMVDAAVDARGDGRLLSTRRVHVVIPAGP